MQAHSTASHPSGHSLHVSRAAMRVVDVVDNPDVVDVVDTVSVADGVVPTVLPARLGRNVSVFTRALVPNLTGTTTPALLAKSTTR